MSPPIPETAGPRSALQRHGELAVGALAALPGLSVTVFDDELRYVLVGGGAVAAHGYVPADLEGRLAADVLPAEVFARWQPYLRGALAGHTASIEHRSQDGTRIYDMRFGPVDGDGVVGGLMVARDVTDQRRAERALAASERDFRDMADNASDVVSRSDEHAVYRYVSASAARVYGYAPAQMVGRPVREFLHADDHVVHRRLRDALAAGSAEEVAELRAARADGRYVWVESRCRALRDGDGRLVGVQTSARDISERKSAEAARASAESEFRTAFDDAPIGMAIVAPDGSWLRVNTALCGIVGYRADELRAMTFQDITHPDDRDADVALAEEVLTGRRRAYQMEKRYVRADGSVVWVLLAVSLVRDEHGQPRHFISQIKDISERKRLEAELRRLAAEDTLTGLANRRALEAALVQQLARCRRHGEDAALLVLDLDDFKSVNDTHGHHAGDALLQHVARVLRERLRTSDTIARLGGDEFAVVLAHTDHASAAALAEELEAELRARPVDVDGVALTASASIGVAALDPAADPGTALRSADHAMYRTKQAR